MPTIETLEPDDLDDVLDHLDLVFSTEASPHHFAQQLPHGYRPENMRQHYVIRERGRIRSLVGLFERNWQVGGVTLPLVGVGGVSTHRSARGRGHMQALMRHCISEMEARGTALSWLQGDRLRYAWFGYELCGSQLRVSLRPGEVRAHPPTDLSFVRLVAGSPWMDDVAALHEARRVRHPRVRSDAHDYLRSWHCEPWVALDPQGAFAGYLVHQPQAQAIHELGAASPDRVMDLACAWIRDRGVGHVLLLEPDPGIARRLAALTGGHAFLEASGNWKVFQWIPVLRALLTERAEAGPVAPGSVVVEVTGEAAFRIDSDGDRFQLTDAPASKADVIWNPLTTMRVLFGPLRPSLAVELPPRLQLLLDQWCPLPLTWAKQDGV